MTPRAAEELYPIRTVASITGVKPVTLRAWERRYGLLRPRRTPSGHRLYTRADVDRLHRVVALLERGVPIGRAIGMLPAEAQALAPARTADAGPGDDAWLGYVQRLLDAAAALDEPALETAYNEALALYSVDMVYERILVPVLDALGERWSRRPAGIAEEHFVSAWLRNKLGARLHHLQRLPGGPRLVAATLPRDPHDLGLLMFGHAAGLRGYRVVMLGAALPLSQIPPTVARCAAQAVVLSVCMEPASREVSRELEELACKLDVPVFVGGARAACIEALPAADALCMLGADLARGLAELDARMGHPETA